MSENDEGAQTETPNITDTIREQVKKDAIFPLERQHKISDWKRFIRKHVHDFKGDISSAAQLMFAYQKGVDYICDKFSPRFGIFKRPDIMILLNESKADSAFASVDDENKILVKKSFLEEFSNLEKGSQTILKRRTGEIVFEGYPNDLFALEGVEEAHHQLFHQIKGSAPDRVGPNSTELTGYDSQNGEYRALRWQLQYAVENKLPAETVQLLRDRLDRAQKIRSEKV